MAIKIRILQSNWLGYNLVRYSSMWTVKTFYNIASYCHSFYQISTFRAEINNNNKKKKIYKAPCMPTLCCRGVAMAGCQPCNNISFYLECADILSTQKHQRNLPNQFLTYKQEPVTHLMSLLRCMSAAVARSCCFCCQDESNDQAVQPQHLGKDQDQNHANKESRLLGGASHACISDHANGKASSQSRQADTQTSPELQERPVHTNNL